MLNHNLNLKLMNLFSSLLKKRIESEAVDKIGGMEDFMTLIKVYYQAVMAANLGITNLAVLPDLRFFKQTLHVPTVNNKLGLGEKKRCKTMLMEIYGIQEFFFKEIDASIKRNCRNVNDIRNYLFMFQGFSQDLMMLMGTLMKWKFRIPGLFKRALRTFTEKTVSDVFVRENWKDEGVRKACVAIRKYQASLGFSQAWIVEYVYNIIILAKKEPKPKDVNDNEKK